MEVSEDFLCQPPAYVSSNIRETLHSRKITCILEKCMKSRQTSNQRLLIKRLLNQMKQASEILLKSTPLIIRCKASLTLVMYLFVYVIAGNVP